MIEPVEQDLLTLLIGFKGRLPDADYTSVRDLVEHREWGIGLENLCTQLHEHSIAIGDAELATIQALATVMDLPVEVWGFLAKD
jgi:hypothetical protein